MPLSRRHFLGAVGVGAASAAAGAPLQAATPNEHRLEPIATDWDLSWVDRVTGKFRGVFDSPSVSEGAGMFRAIIWREQYRAVYGTASTEMSPVLVIRHEALAMAMNDAYWGRFKIGKEEKLKDPATKKWTTINPFRVAAPDTPPKWVIYSLEAFMASGGIVLACNLAFQDVVARIAKAEGLEGDAADKRAREFLLPGVILQPSGVFAVMRAQQAGCHYMVAS